MIKKFLPIAVVFIFILCSTRVYAVDVPVDIPIGQSPTPEATISTTSTPAPTTEATAIPTATSQPSATPLVTPLPSTLPSASVIASTTATPLASSSVLPSSTPIVGGISTNAPASSTSPAPSVSPSVTPAPSNSVEAVLKAPVATKKPVIKDIGDNAYNALLDSPLSFLIGENSHVYYHPHGLSSSSTKILLSIGFIFSLSGFVLMKYPQAVSLLNRFGRSPRFVA